MIGWIILIAWGLGWIGVAPIIAKFLADDLAQIGKLTPGDKATSVLLGMLLAFAWPLIVPGAWVYKKVFSNQENEE